ncbi:uncharacterized protein LOC118418432 isoform X1 [Branchiostoma floridae]|uniref:Uncharacterized protein LOC118418432 isoform X1 n=1 Tax=Branchiostoma floridae TaxID=7739 RepID=A0A9J7MVK0_BRAFL|nr:uncharacterized protein LOC118418432 isoform X1 [Branchiostoma floridae]
MEAVGQTELDGHNHIHLNVGGQWYSVPKCVVGRYRESKLHQAVFRYGSDTNVLFVEGDGRMFQHVLNYLTTGELVLPPQFNEHELLIHEARETYGIMSLVEKLEKARRNNSSGEKLNDRRLRIGQDKYRRRLEMCPEMNSDRPFLTDIATLQKYPLLKQNSILVWLTENGYAFIHCNNDQFRHILNSCHHGVGLIPQDHSEANRAIDEIGRYGVTDKAKYGNTQRNIKKPGSKLDEIGQDICPPIFIMAIEILERFYSTQDLGRLEISPTKDGKGLVVHGSGNVFMQASQCLGVSRLLLLEEMSDFRDMCEAVKVSNIPALVSAVEDFQRLSLFVHPVKQSQKSQCTPLATDGVVEHNGDTTIRSSFGPEVVTVYVGNQSYAASKHMLTEAARQSRIPECVDSVLHLRGDGEMFRHILNYFRTGKLMLPPDFAEHELLRCEANHFGVSSIVSRLHQPSKVQKKAFGKEVEAVVGAKKQKRAKKKRKLCSCPECFSTTSNTVPSSRECSENLSQSVSIESEMVPNQQDGTDVRYTQGPVGNNDVPSSRNSPRHSVFIKMAKTGAGKTTILQGSPLSATGKDNGSNQQKLTFYQGRASVCQVGTDGRLQIELILSKPNNGQKPNCVQRESSDKNDITNHNGNSKTLMESRECCLPSASQRLVQMSKTVLEMTKTDIPLARRQFSTDNIINHSNCSSLSHPAKNDSKVAIKSDHSYSHPPSKVNKSAPNKPSSLKGAMKPPKSKQKQVTMADPIAESHCYESTSNSSQGEVRCEKAEDFGYIAVIKHPHVHGQHKEKGSPYKPLATSRLYVGTQDHPIGNDVAVMSLLNHTRQLCVDTTQRIHFERDKPTEGEAYPVITGKLTNLPKEEQLDVEGTGHGMHTVRQTVAHSGNNITAYSQSRPCAVAETNSAMACPNEKHLVIGLGLVSKKVPKTAKSPDASIESTPKGSIHLRNLTKLCSQVSWLHSVPQQPDITAHSSLTDSYNEKTVLGISDLDSMKENADPNIKPTLEVRHAESSKAQALTSGDISVGVAGSPAERQSTKLPLASTPVDEGNTHQKYILLPLSAKDVVYARMCHRFLLGVIEDSKKLGDVPELTAEVARLVHRLWNAHLSPSTFVDCLSQLAPFKSHTCMHLTPWIKVRTLR